MTFPPLRRTTLLPAVLLLGILTSVVWTQVAEAKKPGSYSSPKITAFSPTSGAVGTTVSFSGSGFSSTRSVKFNGVSATYAATSDTQLTATVPAGATTGPITLTNGSGSTSTTTSFSVTQAQVSPPTISGFSPTSGPAGTSVTISGSSFTGTTAVTFGGTAATFTVNSSSQITTTVPSGASSGSIAVTTQTGTAASASFSVTTSNTTSAIFVAPNGSDTTGDGSISKPFATLGKAQATMRLGGPQITYLRGGTYSLPAVTYNNVTYALRLTSADDGQTWSYYPPDGYDSAVLDGGSTSSSTGIKELITIDGSSHVTINGLQLQHFRWVGIGLHGGGGFYELFPGGTTMADGNTITNNVIHDGSYDTSPIFGYGGGGFYSEGNIPNTTVTNNVISNISAFGIEAAAGNAGQGGNLSSLRIANNVVLSTCLLVGDCGSVYAQDTNTTSTGIRITNNFLRDSGSSTTMARSIYLDDGVSGAVVSDNVSTGKFTWAFTIHAGSNNTLSSNIVDLGPNNHQEILLYQGDGVNPMTGNVIQSNLLVSGGGSGGYEGSSFGTQPTIKNNAYHQYAGSAIYAGGYNGLSGDASPAQLDPQLSCWTYVLSGTSPVYNSPISLASLPRGWGPPGYTVPSSGTAPSQPATC